MAGNGETQGENVGVCENNEHTDLKTLMEIASEDEIITTSEDLALYKAELGIENSATEECKRQIAESTGEDLLKTGLGDALFNTYMSNSRFDLAQRVASIAKISAQELGDQQELEKWTLNSAHANTSRIFGSDTRNN